MDTKQLQAIVEGALLAAGEPLSLKRLESLFEEGEQPSKEQFTQALETIADACAERGFELKEVASGWRLQVREELAPWVNRLWEEKPQKYSRALLETLALIAYRQPITRGDIEEIRGVAVSSHIIKTLTERDWVKVVGQRDVPGRPSLYATTRQFLDYFNLKSLDELPTLSEIRDFDELNNALDLGDVSSPSASDDDAASQDEARLDEESLNEESLEEEGAEGIAEVSEDDAQDRRAEDYPDTGEDDVEPDLDDSHRESSFALSESDSDEAEFSDSESQETGLLASEQNEHTETELSDNPETPEVEEAERNV